MPTPDFRLIDSTFARPDGLTVRGVVHTGDGAPAARWTYTQGDLAMSRTGTPTEDDVKALWNALNDPFFAPFRRDDATAFDPSEGHVLALAFAAEGGDLGHAALVVPFDAEAPVWAGWKARWRALQEASTLDADAAPDPPAPGTSDGPPPLGGDTG